MENYENKFIKETWSCAEKELIEADNLTFIGYSLKEDDYQIRCLLLKALLSKISPYKNIVIIEDETNNEAEKIAQMIIIEKRYQGLYGKVDFKPIGFEAYVNSL